jgi:hypothetical protein
MPIVKRSLHIHLHEPLIASSDVATAAAPETLTYIPGAMLWGLLVGQAYGSGMAKSDILDRYYGGSLVVGDGMPVIGGHLAVPVPLSFHVNKDKAKRATEGFVDYAEEDRRLDYAQVKHGAVIKGQDGIALAEVATTAAMRTAINPATGMAAEGELYTLAALAAGQDFIAEIEGPSDLVDEAINQLAGQQRLGRTRNAEYGTVTIAPCPAAPALPAGAGNDAIYAWCLSDVAAHDARGLPTERPDDAFFGAPISWEQSFARHRRYAPFNATWGRRQTARTVINRGSVFRLKTPVAAGERLLGFNTETGLGRVLFSAMAPKGLIAAWNGTVTLAGVEAEAREGAAPDLIAWLEAKSAKARDRDMQRRDIDEIWQRWKPRYVAAHELAGRAANTPRVGPGPSQWSAFFDMDVAAISVALERLGDQENMREAAVWQARFGIGDEATFVAAAQAELAQGGEHFRRVARTLRTRLLAEKGWFDG